MTMSDGLNQGLQRSAAIGLYDPFDAYKIIEKEIESRMPLSNLHWRYDSSKPAKSISSLPVTIKGEIPKNSNTRNAHQLREPVYLHLMLVQCDLVDVYRSQVRPLVKEWIRNIVLKSESEWMILLVVPSRSKDKNSTLIKASILDKMKIDFGVDGKELPVGFSNSHPNRIVKIRELYEDSASRSESYNALMMQVKNFLLHSFSRRFADLQLQTQQRHVRDQTRQFKSQRKEIANLLNKAELFTDMCLFEDALTYYKQVSTYLDQIAAANPLQCTFSINESLVSLASNDFDIGKSVSVSESRRLLLTLESLSDDQRKLNIFELKCCVFMEQSHILQSLAMRSTSFATSAAHITSLYQRLLLFLSEISMSGLLNESNKASAYEWIFIIIDKYLTLPITQKLFSRSERMPDQSSQQQHPLRDIKECMGELKLFQRTSLVTLGQAKNYKAIGVSVLEEVNLGDDDEEVHVEKLTLEEPYIIAYSPLRTALDTEESFLESYQRLTESTIQDFIASDRERSVDILSIDIALVKYYTKNYREALAILEGSAQFFIENGWNYMGGIILEAYLKCIETPLLVDYEQRHHTEGEGRSIVTVCLELLAIKKSRLKRSSCGLWNSKAFEDSRKIARLFQKIQDYSMLIDTSIEFSVARLFDVLISPAIKSDSEDTTTDLYYLDVSINNVLGSELAVKSVALLATSAGGEAFSFDSSPHDDIILRPGVNSLRLFTTTFVSGMVVISKFTITINAKVALVDRFSGVTGSTDSKDIKTKAEEEDEGNVSVIHNSSLTDSSADTKDAPPLSHSPVQLVPLSTTFQMLFYQRIDNLWGEFVNPPVIELGKSIFLLRLHGGNCDATNVHVKITNLTTGFNIEVKNNGDSCGIHHEKMQGSIEVGSLPKYQTVDIEVYFKNVDDNNDTKKLSLHASISYEVGHRSYNHSWTEFLDSKLSLAVSVQDMFKSEQIFSKFQVGTSDAKLPVRVLSSSLEAPYGSKYKIESPKSDPGPLIAFGDQPTSFVYKIQPLSGSTVVNGTITLKLKIEYSNTQEEIHFMFNDEALRRLRCQNLQSYWILLRNTVFEKISFDLNQYSICGEIVILNKESVLTEAFHQIDMHASSGEVKGQLLKIIPNLLDEFSADTNRNISQGIIKRTLKISVPLPHLRTLHFVEFCYDKDVQYVVGEPISVSLKIHPSSKWADPNETELEPVSNYRQSTVTESSRPSSHGARDFQVSFISDDSWLISGFRKTSYLIDGTSVADEPTEWNLTLIPLNVGNLVMPKLSIKPLDTSVWGDELSDMVIINGSETVLIVPELDSITFTF
ncbi:TRAPP II complex TRAPPC10 C-terminal domain-containing protein [[Candida] zeylanoides]